MGTAYPTQAPATALAEDDRVRRQRTVPSLARGTGVPMHPAGQASGHAGSGMSVHCWRFQQACAAFVFEPVPRAIAWTFERMGAVDQL